MREKEFLIVDGILMVRSVQRVSDGYDVDGRSQGSCVAVTMRPATLDEVSEYRSRQLNKNELEGINGDDT
jgi:hypothetical protein